MGLYHGTWFWMYWNLALACVPLLLSLVLFRRGARHTAGWWAGVCAFVLFLPNAPYVLTDVVHLHGDLAVTDARPLVLARYSVFFALGFAAYVVALWRAGRALGANGWTRGAVAAAYCGLHALSALGIYLGRVHRLNSWDALQQPHDVWQALASGATSRAAWAGVVFTFAVLAFGSSFGLWSLARLRRLRPDRGVE